jgi:hypothetical protein
MNSLTKAGKSKVKIWKSQYTVGGLKSGAYLLKVVIRESHIDTNATTGHIRTRLTMLDTYLPTIGNDIVKFNQHVNTLLEGLTSRDETTNDLLTNLFKGYKAATDKTFVAYIEKKEDKYDEGQTIHPENLMILAVNKYKILKEKNEWEAPSAGEEKIMALEARITKMAKGNQSSGRTKTTPKSSKPASKDMSWKYAEPPDADKGKSITWNDKEWWWCNNHKAFVRHKPDECEGKGVKPDAKSEKGKVPAKDAKNNRQLKFSKALQAVNKGEEEDDESSEEE